MGDRTTNEILLHTFGYLDTIVQEEQSKKKKSPADVNSLSKTDGVQRDEAKVVDPKVRR